MATKLATSKTTEIKLAHSPDSDDAFMFYALATNRVKAEGLKFTHILSDIETLNKFSVTECRNKFAVASDADQSITKAYDAVLAAKPEYANRTSYVIAPTGKIIYEYTAMNPDKHVENTMAAVQKWQDAHKSGGY